MFVSNKWKQPKQLQQTEATELDPGAGPSSYIVSLLLLQSISTKKRQELRFQKEVGDKEGCLILLLYVVLQTICQPTKLDSEKYPSKWAGS